MPEIGCQVYWYNPPTPQCPWESEEELREIVRISQRIDGPISERCNFVPPTARSEGMRNAKLLLHPYITTPHSVTMKERYSHRCSAYSAIREGRLLHHHRGIVLEPNMGPLNALNLLMKELGQPPITESEAIEAVNHVKDEYTSMTQSATVAGGNSQSPRPTGLAWSQDFTSCGSNREAGDAVLHRAHSRSVRRRMKSHAASQPEEASACSLHLTLGLSQSQLGLSQTFTDLNPPTQLSQEAPVFTDVPHAPLYEVVKRLCADRKMVVETLTQKELRAKRRIPAADLIPRRKALIAVDRSAPHFILAFGDDQGCAVLQKREREVLRHSWLDLTSSESGRESDTAETGSTSSGTAGRGGGGGGTKHRTERGKAPTDTPQGTGKKRRRSSSLGEAAERHTRLVSNTLTSLGRRYIQVIAPTSTPVPWRRCFLSQLPYLPPKECVVGFIYAPDLSAPARIDSGATCSRSAAAHPLSDAVLGGEPVVRTLLTTGGTAWSTRRYLRECDSSFALTEFGSEPLFSEQDRHSDDPLFQVPIVDTTGFARTKRNEKYDWVQRLIEATSRTKLYALVNHVPTY